MKAIWRWVRYTAGAIVAVAILVVALNWTMITRLATMKSRGIDVLEGYTPLGVVPGAKDITPFDHDTIDTAVLDDAYAYHRQRDGLVMIVAHRGRILREDYAPGIGPDSRFETASMHKSVMGLVYGAAIRDGAIGSIDDPVGTYIEEWAHDPRGSIPLRAFLSMASGLEFFTLSKSDWPALKLVMSNEVSATALGTKIEMPALTRFEYYNVNSQIAGIALDRALKRKGLGDYASYLSRALWQPMGGAGARLWLEHLGGDPRFFAGLQTTAQDWLRIGMVILRNGKVDDTQVIPAEWVATMTAPSPLNPNYGMQIWRGSPYQALRAYGPRTPVKIPHAEAYLADDVLFFDGFGGQRVYIVPSLDLVIVRIGRPRIDFDDSVIPNAVIRGLKLAP